ncbi:MAG: short-chain dehydrogenase, partial [Clostridia bacterium]|nr:short-chain dehydrogenase [Clostridia bacterium]
GFTAAPQTLHAGDDVYGGRISRSVAGMEHDEQTGMAPETAGRFICKMALRKRVKPINTIGFSYSFLCILARLLPQKLLNHIVGLLYAK